MAAASGVPGPSSSASRGIRVPRPPRGHVLVRARHSLMISRHREHHLNRLSSPVTHWTSDPLSVSSPANSLVVPGGRGRRQVEHLSPATWSPVRSATVRTALAASAVSRCRPRSTRRRRLGSAWPRSNLHGRARPHSTPGWQRFFIIGCRPESPECPVLAPLAAVVETIIVNDRSNRACACPSKQRGWGHEWKDGEGGSVKKIRKERKPTGGGRVKEGECGAADERERRSANE